MSVVNSSSAIKGGQMKIGDNFGVSDREIEIIKEVTDILGYSCDPIYCVIQKTTLEHVLAEDRRQGLVYHDIWYDHYQKVFFEKYQKGWMVMLHRQSASVQDPTVQIMAYSLRFMTDNLLPALLDAIEKMDLSKNTA